MPSLDTLSPNAGLFVSTHKSTINVPDLQPGYSLTFPTPSSISFTGTSGGSKAVPSKSFEIESLELFGEIDLEADRKEKLTGKSLQLVLTKKDLNDEYWPRFVIIVFNPMTFPSHLNLWDTDEHALLKLLSLQFYSTHAFFRLTKDKRVNFVKTDFALWVDEDEQNGVAVDEGFASTGAPPGAGKISQGSNTTDR
jgi:hypothetical protein